MNITFHYFAQIRQRAGAESETIQIADGATALETLKKADHGDGFRSLLFDTSGALRPVILLVVNGVPAAPEQVLQDGDCVNIFSPVAGG